jgi:hypothetical protein
MDEPAQAVPPTKLRDGDVGLPRSDGEGEMGATWAHVVESTLKVWGYRGKPKRFSELRLGVPGDPSGLESK